MTEDQLKIVSKLARSISALQGRVLERKLGQMLDYAFEIMDEKPADFREQRIAFLENALRAVMLEIEGCGIGCSKEFQRMALDSVHAIAARALLSESERLP